MVLLKHLNEGVTSQGVTQDAQISPGRCDIATTFRARQNLLDQIVLQLYKYFDIVCVHMYRNSIRYSSTKVQQCYNEG